MISRDNQQKKEILLKVKISSDASIKSALKKIDQAGLAILFVCDKEDKLEGVITDGDIRRQILKDGDLTQKIEICCNRSPVVFKKGKYTLEQARKTMLEKTIEVIPVLDENNYIVDLLFWRDLFEDESKHIKKIDVPVVIMAGGKGTRLEPFTKILPKPLMPIGEKPAIRIIIDRFNRYGVNHFYVTLNHKGEMIKVYLESAQNDFDVDYIWEEQFLGTAGGLKLLPLTIGDTFIVSNCDVIVKADYSDLLRFHNDSRNLLTVVGAIYHHQIPYGVINFEKEGKIKHIKEKPEFDFTVNTGMYVMSSKVLEFIPKDKNFDMTDLVAVLLDSKKNVGVYPVSEKSYVDIGQWKEYREAIDKLGLFE
ncbi:MAG: nucleotidyltransferase family protein [Phycisphaerae bacterium]|jgi:dTDP-glucose pyrophosphorylase